MLFFVLLSILILMFFDLLNEVVNAALLIRGTSIDDILDDDATTQYLTDLRLQ